jgi:hypothetical protein
MLSAGLSVRAPSLPAIRRAWRASITGRRTCPRTRPRRPDGRTTCKPRRPDTRQPWPPVRGSGYARFSPPAPSIRERRHWAIKGACQAARDVRQFDNRMAGVSSVSRRRGRRPRLRRWAKAEDAQIDFRAAACKKPHANRMKRDDGRERQEGVTTYRHAEVASLDEG